MNYQAVAIFLLVYSFMKALIRAFKTVVAPENTLRKDLRIDSILDMIVYVGCFIATLVLASSGHLQ